MGSTAALTPTPKMQFSDASGIPLAGGKVYSYVAGTSSALATFTDSTETSQNTNPIILDAGGFANIWLGASFYKFVVQDVNGVQQYITDNVSSSNLPFVTTFNLIEGTAPAGIIGNDLLYGDLVNHRPGMVNNAGAGDLIVGQNTTDTLANKTLTSPIIHTPTIDAPNVTGSGTFVGTNAFSGDNTFTGKNDMKIRTLNTTVYADQFPGATADIQINTAIAALPAVGGTVNCTGYGATVQTIAAPIIIGSATKQVCMIIDRATQYNITIFTGADVIQLWIESALIALDMGNVQAVGNFVVRPGANINNVLASYPRAGPSIMNVRGITFAGAGAGGATMTGAAIDMAGVTDKSTVQECITYNFPTWGLRLQNVAGGVPTGPVNITNCSFNGSGLAGARPVLINGVAGGGVMADVNFFGGSITHPGAGGLPCVDIQGGAANAINNINFYGTQFESINAADIGINIVNATGINGSGLLFSAAVTAGACCIKIATAGGGASYNHTFDNITNFNSWTATLIDSTNGVTLTDARLTHYSYIAPTANSCQTYGTSGLILSIATGAITASQPLTLKAATPTGSGTDLGLGITQGFGNGAAATAVTTTLKGTGSGPTTPQTVVKYLSIDIGGTKYWVPLVV